MENLLTVVSMPLYIETGKIKIRKNYINLNVYRNLHYQVNNQIKIAYKELVLSQIEGLRFGRIRLNFVLYRGDRRRVDRSNILSIHEKYFCDALVESGCIEDDNDNFLESTHYYTGNVDKENPRVEVRIVNA